MRNKTLAAIWVLSALALAFASFTAFFWHRDYTWAGLFAACAVGFSFVAVRDWRAPDEDL